MDKISPDKIPFQPYFYTYIAEYNLKQNKTPENEKFWEEALEIIRKFERGEGTQELVNQIDTELTELFADKYLEIKKEYSQKERK